MTPADLMLLHLGAMFTLQEDGSLLTVNEPWDKTCPAPLLFAAFPREGRPFCRGRAGIAQKALRQAQRLAEQGVRKAAPYEEALGLSLAGEREVCLWRPNSAPLVSPPTACVELTGSNLGQYDLGEFRWLAEELPMASPCFAYFAEGTAISVCRSVRIHTGHEAGVETSPAWRGRGLAPVVVTAWANAVERLGRVPLYTASAENRSSLRLAEKCGFLPYGETLAFTAL